MPYKDPDKQRAYQREYQRRARLNKKNQTRRLTPIKSHLKIPHKNPSFSAIIGDFFCQKNFMPPRRFTCCVELYY